MSWGRQLGIALIVLLLLVGGGLGAGWYVTQGEYPVAATVTGDPSLPQIDVEGIALHSEAFGDPMAPVVVVLHGGPGLDYRNLLPLKALSDEYRVVFYDQRGSGLSQRVPTASISVDALLAELDGVIRHYAADRPVHLIGHSWGGMLATAYAARNPTRIERLVLVEPDFLTGSLGTRVLDRLRPEPTVDYLTHVAETWLRSMHVQGPDDQAAADFRARRIMRWAGQDNPERAMFCQGELPEAYFDLWRAGSSTRQSLLASMRAPSGVVEVDFLDGIARYDDEVLILASTCNQVTGLEHQEQHRAAFQRARIEVIDDAGHLLLATASDDALPAIRAHLRKPVEPTDTEESASALKAGGPALPPLH